MIPRRYNHLHILADMPFWFIATDAFKGTQRILT
jgi:hypothetical protein